VDTIIVVGDINSHLSPFAHRALYAPINGDTKSPLFGLKNQGILTIVKGYPAALLHARQATLIQLYSAGNTPAERQAAIDEILMLNRPLAVVTQRASDQALEVWLQGEQQASLRLQNRDRSLWFFRPSGQIEP
jgi:hypothetical protein